MSVCRGTALLWTVLLGAAVCVLGTAGDAEAAAPGDGWEWPLAGAPPVARAFAPPPAPYAAGHRGVDLAAAPGVPVLAAGAGRVSYAGLLAGRGVVVVVHGALRTTYEPVTPDVAVGQAVGPGSVLGRLAAGHDGCRAPACLHWGLRRGDVYLDPLTLVGAGPVRLLPLAGSAGSAGSAGASAAAAAPAAAPVPPADEPAPSLRLRSAASPSGLLALLALLAGLALLRPRRPPSLPGGTAAGRPAADQPVAPPTPQTLRSDDVVDLGRERARRRAAG